MKILVENVNVDQFNYRVFNVYTYQRYGRTIHGILLSILRSLSYFPMVATNLVEQFHQGESVIFLRKVFHFDETKTIKIRWGSRQNLIR